MLNRNSRRSIRRGKPGGSTNPSLPTGRIRPNHYDKPTTYNDSRPASSFLGSLDARHSWALLIRRPPLPDFLLLETAPPSLLRLDGQDFAPRAFRPRISDPRCALGSPTIRGKPSGPRPRAARVSLHCAGSFFFHMDAMRRPRRR